MASREAFFSICSRAAPAMPAANAAMSAESPASMLRSRCSVQPHPGAPGRGRDRRAAGGAAEKAGAAGHRASRWYWAQGPDRERSEMKAGEAGYGRDEIIGLRGQVSVPVGVPVAEIH